MTEEGPKRKKRTKEAIAAEKKAWLLRHEWAGPKEAKQMLEDAYDLVEQAVGACGKSVNGIAWEEILPALNRAAEQIDAAIPPEAR